MKKRMLGIFLATTLAMSSVLVGCGGDKKTSTNTDTAKTETTNEKKSDKPKVLNFSSGKFKTLNPHRSETVTESNNMSYILSAMLVKTLNKSGDGFEFVGAHAKELPKVSEDKKTWTFKLKDNLKWDDGTPIDAESYVYSYKMLLDPKLKNRNASAFFEGIYVKGAKDYFEGKCDWDKVGIKATDKTTLQIELETPAPTMEVYKAFESGTTPASAPIHKKLYEDNMNAEKTETKYGTNKETTPSCGPYKIKEWKQDQLLAYEKNPNSPIANMYTPDFINRKVVEDQNTQLQLFEKGELDSVSVGGANYDKYKEDPRMKNMVGANGFSMFVNMTSKANPVIANKDFRKALYWGLNREKINKDLFKTNPPATCSIGPTCIIKPGVAYHDTEQYKSTAGKIKNNGYDAKAAKEFFDKAYAANGNQKVTFEVMYSETADILKKLAEFMEQEYEGNFGKDKFDLKLKAVPSKPYFEIAKQDTTDAFFAQISGDELYPWNTMQSYISTEPDKIDRLNNAEFDKLYERCVKGDLLFKDKEKIDALARMDSILMEELPFIPMVYTGNGLMYSDKVKLKTKNEMYIPGFGFGVLQADIVEK